MSNREGQVLSRRLSFHSRGRRPVGVGLPGGRAGTPFGRDNDYPFFQGSLIIRLNPAGDKTLRTVGAEPPAPAEPARLWAWQ